MKIEIGSMSLYIKKLESDLRARDLEEECYQKLIQDKNVEIDRLKNQFCSCDSEIKTGWTSAKHCNMCGKLEPEETWLKPLTP